MNNAVDERVREMVRTSSDETREAVFQDLLRELMTNRPNETEMPLESSAGTLFGFFTRADALPGAPSEVELAVQAMRVRHHLTNEEIAERAQFEFKPEELMDAEEFTRWLRQQSPVGSR